MSETKTNMDCADIRALLSALVDDQSDTETRHLAERHVSTCTSCRKMLDEAEALDDLVSRDVDALTGGPALPAGFESAVIEKALLERPTVRRSLVTWAGWFAAAACLTLAVLIWSFDRNMWINSAPVPVAAGGGDTQTDALSEAGKDSVNNLVRTANYQRRSWTYDGDLPASALPATGNDVESVESTLHTIKPAQPTMRDQAKQVGREAAALAAQRSTLTEDDAQTLYAVSLLMETLAEADLQSFEEVDRIRRITEYDDLLPRLAETRQRLIAEDRAIALVAESILLRIVRGPVTEAVARELWSDASQFDLAEALQSMSDDAGPRPTL